MGVLDWLIVGGLFFVIAAVAIYTKRYTRSVADFLSANRCAGRYMLTMSEGMSSFSAVGMIAVFEMYYRAGFVARWWGALFVPITVIIALSGWVTYRFRETRAMTMAQFFEIRYSRKFRVFAGTVAWFAGIVNYGIFPGVTARLLIYFCSLPQSFPIFGLDIPTFPVVMIVMLSVAVTLTLSGGQIALMVTDFLQAQTISLVLLGITVFVFCRFGWSGIMAGLKGATENESMLNPLKTGGVEDFNLWYFVMMAFITFYGFMAWQGSQGYYSSAKSPHEAKMARVLAEWRHIVLILMLLMVPVVTYAVFHNDDYSADASAIQKVLDGISDPQRQTQMRVPLTLVHFLPTGLVGLFAVVIIGAAVSTDDTYLHSWGVIFVQDVLLPLRKKPLSPAQHLKWLRIAIFVTAIFAFFFSMVFPLRDYILMYFQITGAIYIGGAGSAIIGGLYWKRGTTAGAWCAMITGSILAVSGICLRTFWQNIPVLVKITPECPLNGIQMTCVTGLIGVFLYVTVSLLSRKPAFNMEKMLHRGKYAIEGEHVERVKKTSLIAKLTGIDKEFTRGDKFIAIFLIVQTTVWFCISFVGTIYGLGHEISDDAWGRFWLIMVIWLTLLAFVTVIWFLIGGLRDMKDMFKTLKTVKRDELDDGRVVAHHSLADESLGVPADGNDSEKSVQEKSS